MFTSGLAQWTSVVNGEKQQADDSPSNLLVGPSSHRKKKTDRGRQDSILSENSVFTGGIPTEDGEDGALLSEPELSSTRRKSRARVQFDSQSDYLNMETESVISATSDPPLVGAAAAVGPVVVGVDGVLGPPHLVVEKRTRFSLSVDQESVGTTDNLEAISEAASNHSVDSSLDTAEDEEADAILGTDVEEEAEGVENLNDNLSDMISANVSSGRGSPNVSGRDSPISRDSSTESDDNDHHDHHHGHHAGRGEGAVAVEVPIPISPVLGVLPIPHQNNSSDISPAEPTASGTTVSIGVGTSDKAASPISASIEASEAETNKKTKLTVNGSILANPSSVSQPLSGRIGQLPSSRHGHRPPAHSRRSGGHGGYGPGTAAAALRRIPVTHSSRANNREDIEDKFGKFDVKNQVHPPGDETKSIMSDTWSTDVLASDSEQTDSQQPERSTPGSVKNAHASDGTQTGPHGQQGSQDLGGGLTSSGALSLFDESQSDAWSTSVAASDTARFQDFDPDETASSTRSESLVDRSDMEEFSQLASIKELSIGGGSGKPTTGKSNSTDPDEHPLTASTDSTDTVHQQQQKHNYQNYRSHASNATHNNLFSSVTGPVRGAGIVITGPSPIQTPNSSDTSPAAQSRSQSREGGPPKLDSPSSPTATAANRSQPPSALLNGSTPQDSLSRDLSQLALQKVDDEEEDVFVDMEPSPEKSDESSPVDPPQNHLPGIARPTTATNGNVPTAASGAIPKVRPTNQSNNNQSSNQSGPANGLNTSGLRGPSATNTSSSRSTGRKGLLSGPINTLKAVKDKIQRPQP